MAKFESPGARTKYRQKMQRDEKNEEIKNFHEKEQTRLRRSVEKRKRKIDKLEAENKKKKAK